MRDRFACLATIALLVSACASGEPVPAETFPPIYQAPIASPAPREPFPADVRDGLVFPDIPPSDAARLSTVSPLPPRPPPYPMTPPSVSAPVGAAPNFGPITGYGPGGMGHLPGSPPNPPYN
jgi:hypothetical protein